jgi:hypothetical protein
MATTTVTPTTFFRGATNGTIATLVPQYSTTSNIVITNVIVTNASTSAQKITVTIPSGSSDIPILYQAVINANDTVSFDMKQPATITSGTNAIKVSSDSSSVYVHIAGVVISTS